MGHVHIIANTVLNSEDKFGVAGTVKVRRGDMFVIGGIILYNEKSDTVDIPIADGSFLRNVSLGHIELLGGPEVHVVEEEKVVKPVVQEKLVRSKVSKGDVDDGKN